MFPENHNTLIIFVILACTLGGLGLYLAYVVTKPSKTIDDPIKDGVEFNDPLAAARANYLEKLQEITKSISTRYLVYCQEKRDENAYIDSSLSRFERDCDKLFAEWKKETQLCRSHYLLSEIFEKFQLKTRLLCEEQKVYFDTISTFTSRTEKKLSITA
jgi:hypothetical protein